jgi:acetyl esterase/lipase
MNKLTIIKLISRIRREPFAVSTTPAPSTITGPGDGELVRDLSPAQVPRREQKSTLIESVVYAERTDGKKARPLHMDLHVPDAPGVYPLVLYIAGGGFALALYQMARAQRGYVADAGFVVASMEYRTANDGATLEDGLTDVSDALTYLRAHAAEFKIDPTRVALWGESAGAYLAALTATRGTAGTPIRGVVDIVGASDLAQVTDGFDEATRAMWHGADSSVSRYVGNPPTEESNPLRYVDSTTPPFLLVHGDDDRIVSPRQSLILHRALTAAGVPSRRIVLAGAGHGELALRTSDIKVWTSRALLDVVVAFLRAHTMSPSPDLAHDELPADSN